MRDAGLLALLTLLGGFTDEKLNGLIQAVEGPISKLCNSQQVGSLSQVYDEIVEFTIKRESPGNGDDCVQSFMAIVTQCIQLQHASGGLIKKEDNGSQYRISSSKPVAVLLKDRSPKVGSKPAPKPKPDPQPAPPKPEPPKPEPPKPEPPKPEPPKPEPPKPEPPQPAPPKPYPKPLLKPSPNPSPKTSPSPSPKSSSLRSSTATSSSAAAEKTPTCKELYAQQMIEARRTGLTTEKRGTGRALRDGYSGSRVHIEKRYSEKIGSGCGVTLNAWEYPNKREMKSANKKELWYGFTQPKVCNNYVFRAANSPATGVDQGDYHHEHVLEWQVVTKFFDWVKNKKRTGITFDNPDRSSAQKKVDFCGYWKATWSQAEDQHVLVSFDIPSGPAGPRLPPEHIKDAYPGRREAQAGKPAVNAFFEDFVYLHGLLNTAVKSNMWAEKNDANAGVFNQAKIRRRARSKTVANGKRALADLRNLLGARKYMADKAIQGILKRQKERMGKALGELDTEMERHAKPNFNAWQRQGLGDLWNEYMNGKFQEAKRRTEADMNTYLNMLIQTWTPPTQRNRNQQTRDLWTDNQGLKKQWDLEKRKPWAKPWTT